MLLSGGCSSRGLDLTPAGVDARARELLTKLATAQENYKAANGRYAVQLSQLIAAGAVTSKLADGHDDHVGLLFIGIDAERYLALAAGGTTPLDYAAIAPRSPYETYAIDQTGTLTPGADHAAGLIVPAINGKARGIVAQIIAAQQAYFAAHGEVARDLAELGDPPPGEHYIDAELAGKTPGLGITVDMIGTGSQFEAFAYGGDGLQPYYTYNGDETGEVVES